MTSEPRERRTHIGLTTDSLQLISGVGSCEQKVLRVKDCSDEQRNRNRAERTEHQGAYEQPRPG
jgi:hypothetical protein